jgi:hypothetical protein
MSGKPRTLTHIFEMVQVYSGCHPQNEGKFPICFTMIYILSICIYIHGKFVGYSLIPWNIQMEGNLTTSYNSL